MWKYDFILNYFWLCETNSNIYQLNAHRKMEHLINFIDNKTSCLNFIYYMSQNEFTMIRNYLNDVLKKQWIHSFFSFINAPVLFTKKSNDDLYFCVNYWNFNEFIIKNKYFLFLLFKLLNRFAHVKRFSKIDL